MDGITDWNISFNKCPKLTINKTEKVAFFLFINANLRSLTILKYLYGFLSK